MNPPRSGRSVGVFALFASTAFLAGSAAGVLGVCGPFTDVAADSFCPFVLEIFALGITTGTSPTTYDPSSVVTRLQMAAFLSRGVDSVLKRGSRRAALGQYWMTSNIGAAGLTTVGPQPALVKSDGADLWVSQGGGVTRVRASDGAVLGTWTGGTAWAPLVARGKVYFTTLSTPGMLFEIDPTQPPGAATAVAPNLGNGTTGLAFDGTRFWTANFLGKSVSIVTPGQFLPWNTSTVTTGFSTPNGALFDGASVWVTDYINGGSLLKLDTNGAVLQSVTVGSLPKWPIFDGANIWVPAFGNNSVKVVRASTGAVLATLTGNGLSSPTAAAFDGERILVTNSNGNSVSLWKAADLSVIGTISTGPATTPTGACSDGTAFWVTL